MGKVILPLGTGFLRILIHNFWEKFPNFEDFFWPSPITFLFLIIFLIFWIAFRILICFHNWSQKRNQFLFQLSSPRAIMQIRACGGRDQHMCKTLFNLKNRAGRQKYKNTIIQTYTRSTCIYCVGLFEIYRTGNYKNAHICKMLDSDMTV